MPAQTQRCAIIEFHKKKLKNTQMSALLKLLKMAVWRTIKRFKKLQTVSDMINLEPPAL